MEEVKRLGGNINKVIDRVEALEKRVQELETEKTVSSVRDEVLINKFESATRAAAAEAHANLIERIVRLEMVCGSTNDPNTKLLPPRQ